MHYELRYSGQPHDVSAQLLCGGEVVATAEDLEDRRAAEKWAAKAARDHKVENTPAATQRHSIVLSGTKTFSL